MAAATFLYQPTLVVIDSGGTSPITVDASIKEDHNAEIEVTDHAVEQGAAITDHARPKPVELSIEGMVTNTPISRGQIRNVTSAMGTVQTTSTSSYAAGAPGFAEAAYAALRALRDTPKLVTITTGLRKYDNMLMTSLNVPRDAKSGEALNFTVKFKEVRLVVNTTTVVATKQPKAKKPKKSTTSTTTPTPTPTPTSMNGMEDLGALGLL